MVMITLNNIGNMKDLIHKILKEEYNTNQHLTDTSDSKYKHLLGKRVCVDTKSFRDKQGKLKQSRKGDEFCGIVKFIGINPSHGEFQVTLDSTPLFPVNPKEIKVVE